MRSQFRRISVHGALLGTSLALAALFLVNLSASSAEPQILGDADCDGEVASADSLAALLVVAEIPPDPFCAAAADVDCDEIVDVADAEILLTYLAGLYTAPTVPSAWSCSPIGQPIPTPTVSGQPTPTDSVTPTPTASPTPTATPSPTPTATPVPCPLGLPATPAPSPATPSPGDYTLTPLPADAGRGELTDIAMIPGGGNYAVITVKTGELWTVCLSNNLPATSFGDLTDRVVTTNDEGLLSIAFDPADPSVVYLNYTQGAGYYNGVGTPPPNPRRSTISRFGVSNGAIVEASEEVIIEVWHPWSWHNVGELAFGPDGLLYIGSGDGGGNGSEARGQTLDDLWGGILRIDVHDDSPYEVPQDNPFADGPGPNADELWAYGLRNPWRFSFDSQTGAMWIGDPGDVTWEEIDIGQAGANYGWAIVEGNECVDGLPCDTTGLTPPRAVYSHGEGCAVIGGHVYRGAAMPEFGGYYTYADFCSARIWGIDVTNPSSPPILLGDVNVTGLNPTSFTEDPNGELVVVSKGGGVYRLERLP